MHEIAVAQSIIDIVRARFEQSTAIVPVLAVRIAVGEFRNIEVEALLFAFDTLKQGTADLDGCKLLVDQIESKATCHKLGHVYKPSFAACFRCPQCGDSIGELVHGEELDVIAIEIELTGKEGTGDYARVG